MRIISRKALIAFWKRHPVAQQPLTQWHERTRHARWKSFVDVKATFGRADQVRVGSGQNVAIFDIGGNKFRLVAAIHYNTEKVFVLRVLTHEEYDTQKWKQEL